MLLLVFFILQLFHRTAPAKVLQIRIPTMSYYVDEWKENELS